jgi:hypothetical protein
VSSLPFLKTLSEKILVFVQVWSMNKKTLVKTGSTLGRTRRCTQGHRWCGDISGRRSDAGRLVGKQNSNIGSKMDRHRRFCQSTKKAKAASQAMQTDLGSTFEQAQIRPLSPLIATEVCVLL